MPATPLDQFDKEVNMSFMEHIEALRWHIMRVAIVVVVFAILAFMYNEIVFDKIFMGPAQVDFFTYKLFCKYLPDEMCVKSINFLIINTDISGQFTKHISTSFTVGLVMATPYMLYEIWRFISPALSVKERNSAKGFTAFAGGLFFIGLLFGYFFITPVSIQFLGNYQVSVIIKNYIDMSSYLDTVVMMSFSTALVFELPVVVLILSNIGILTPDLMKRYRRQAVLIILVLSAIITPSPDVSSMLVLAIPFYGLYEVSIFISKRVYKKKQIENNI